MNFGESYNPRSHLTLEMKIICIRGIIWLRAYVFSIWIWTSDETNVSMVYNIWSNSNSENSKEKGYIFKNKVLGESQVNSEMKNPSNLHRKSAHLQEYFFSTGFSVSCVQYVTL